MDVKFWYVLWCQHLYIFHIQEEMHYIMYPLWIKLYLRMRFVYVYKGALWWNNVNWTRLYLRYHHIIKKIFKYGWSAHYRSFKWDFDIHAMHPAQNKFLREPVVAADGVPVENTKYCSWFAVFIVKTWCSIHPIHFNWFMITSAQKPVKTIA